MGKRRTFSWLFFTDLLFNLVIGLLCLYFLALLLINPISEDKKIDSKAEFIITLDWPDHHNGDVDLWVRDPNGAVVGYTAKERDTATLERDDIGSASDTHINAQGITVYNPVNNEITTIRGISPGEWAVNVHYYRSRPITEGHISGKTTPPYTDAKRIPVAITVKIIKLNPSYVLIKEKSIILTVEGEERTILRFVIDEEGNVERFIKDPINFVVDPGDNAVGGVYN